MFFQVVLNRVTQSFILDQRFTNDIPYQFLKLGIFCNLFQILSQDSLHPWVIHRPANNPLGDPDELIRAGLKFRNGFFTNKSLELSFDPILLWQWRLV